MSDIQELADRTMRAAKNLYARDGGVWPMLHLIYGPGEDLFARPHEGDPERTIPELLAKIAVVAWPTRIAVAVEVWASLADPDDEVAVQRLSNIQDGDLERAADAGDPTVQTAVVVHVMDTVPGDETIVMSVPEILADGTTYWHNLDRDIPPQGRMPELLRLVLDGVRIDATLTIPPALVASPPPLSEVFKVMVDHELCQALLVEPALLARPLGYGRP